jgi:hypothetical protein
MLGEAVGNRVRVADGQRLEGGDAVNGGQPGLGGAEVQGCFFGGWLAAG